MKERLYITPEVKNEGVLTMRRVLYGLGALVMTAESDGTIPKQFEDKESVLVLVIPDQNMPSKYMRVLTSGRTAIERGIPVPELLTEYLRKRDMPLVAVKLSSCEDRKLHGLTTALKNMHLRDFSGGHWIGPKVKKPSRREIYQRNKSERARSRHLGYALA